MAVVSGIVKSHKGLIDIQTAPGKGTVFEVYLPSFQGEIIAKESHEANLPVGNGEKILLVDDEKDIIDVGAEILETLGYKVMTANGGEEAIKLYEENIHKEYQHSPYVECPPPESQQIHLA